MPYATNVAIVPTRKLMHASATTRTAAIFLKPRGVPTFVPNFRGEQASQKIQSLHVSPLPVLQRFVTCGGMKPNDFPSVTRSPLPLSPGNKSTGATFTLPQDPTWEGVKPEPFAPRGVRWEVESRGVFRSGDPGSPPLLPGDVGPPVPPIRKNQLKRNQSPRR